ncbi:MAG: hypothetical protein EVA91_06555 [SAR116 cluster bacterium]|nr:MAG: hypothetical protein EVA91_06555 [SAR116 cluster bacterium]
MKQSHFWAAMGAAVGRLVLPAGQPLGLALFLLFWGLYASGAAPHTATAANAATAVTGKAGAVGKADEDAPPPISTVFLVCEGVFTLQSDRFPDQPPEEFDGSLYLSVTHQGDEFTQIKVQPFARTERQRSQTFIPTPPPVKDAPTDMSADTETHHVEIAASNDEVTLTERRASGVHVKASVDDQPLVNTRAHVQTVEMSLNRFSGKLKMRWDDRNVEDHRPAGAIRATKITNLDRKSFAATCHTMKERLF